MDKNKKKIINFLITFVIILLVQVNELVPTKYIIYVIIPIILIKKLKIKNKNGGL